MQEQLILALLLLLGLFPNDTYEGKTLVWSPLALDSTLELVFEYSNVSMVLTPD